SGTTGTSTGVRGIRLGKGDELISISILRHMETTQAEREAYLKLARAVAGEETAPLPEDEAETPDEAEENGEPSEEASAEAVEQGEIMLSQERYVEMSEAEQTI